MNTKDFTLHDRMKDYEQASQTTLMKRNPVVIRIDGQAFSNYTKHFEKPFDSNMMYVMEQTMLTLCKKISNVKFAYTTSDEITLILDDTQNKNTEAFFGNNLQKLVSISASVATMAFNYHFMSRMDDLMANGEDVSRYQKALLEATFDARAFSIPRHELNNVILERQNAGKTNSLNAFAQSIYSAKSLHGLKMSGKLARLVSDGYDYDSLSNDVRLGVSCYKQEETTEDGHVKTRYVVDHKTPDLLVDKTFVSRKVND